MPEYHLTRIARLTLRLLRMSCKNSPIPYWVKMANNGNPYFPFVLRHCSFLADSCKKYHQYAIIMINCFCFLSRLFSSKLMEL